MSAPVESEGTAPSEAAEPTEPPPPPRKPPAARGFVYAVTVFTFLCMVTASSALVVLVLAVFDPSLDVEAFSDPDRMAALTEQPGFLVLSVIASSGSLALGGILGSLAGPQVLAAGPTLAARLGFARVPALDVVVIGLGTLGFGAALDALVFFFGLRDVGSLGVLHRVLGSLDGLALIGGAALIGLGPGFGEEIFFRGFMLRRLRPGDGTKIALVASSVAFGLFHFDPVHSPAAAALGIYLGVAVLATGSIWTSIFAHSLNNAVATLLAPVTLGAHEHGVLLGTGVVSAVFALRFVARRAGWPGSTGDPRPG